MIKRDVKRVRCRDLYVFDVMYVFLRDGCGFGEGGGEICKSDYMFPLDSESRSYLAHIVSIHYINQHINQTSLSFDIFNRCM